MNFKKTHVNRLAALLICIMVLSTGFESTVAYADTKSSGSKITENGIVYHITEEYAKVVGYTGNPVNVTIPESIRGTVVAFICADAFSGCTTLKSVRIPKTVIKLEDGDFTLENVTYVPHGAFANCSALETVHIPSDSSLFYIGKCSFANCSALTSIILPSSVRFLGLSCFSNCSAIKSLELPEGVDIVEQDALSGSGIQTLRLPASLASFHPWIYMDELQEIVVAEGNSRYKSIDGVLYTNILGTWYVMIYPAMKKNAEYVLPEGYLIYPLTFAMKWRNFEVYDLPYLRAINIGKSQINDLANIIYTIIVDDDNPYYSSVNGVLCDKEEKNVLQISRYADKHIVIPDGVTTIMDGAGEYSNFSSIVFPPSLRRIGSFACSHNLSIKNVTIPFGVTSIESSAFYECNALSSITIPKSVTFIGEYAIPEWTTIYCYENTIADQWAREHGNKIVHLANEEALILPAELRYIEEEAFSATAVKVVNCSEGIISIGPRAFADCTSLVRIYIPESCESISETAFVGCSDTLIICGKVGSEAEKFANRNGYAFVDLR